MKKYIFILISIIIDGLIPNITLFDFNNITYFSSLCTLVSLVIVYDDKYFYHLLIFTGIIYGSLYHNNLLISFVLFFSSLIIIKYYKRIFTNNLGTIILEILISICFYELLYFLIMSFFVFNNFNYYNYLYKVTHSIVFNILYGISFFYLYDKNGSKKYF